MLFRSLQMTEDFINGNASHHHVVNVPNFDKKLCSSLPEGAILEVPGSFKDGKMVGMNVGSLDKMDPEIVKLISMHCKTQDYVVDAWQKADTEILLKGLLHDPMCAFIEDEKKIEAMMWNMLFYQKKWLPTFSEVIPKTESDLKELVGEYFVSKKDLATQADAYKVKWAPKEELRSKCLPPFE